jgi:hypothetical protein
MTIKIKPTSTTATIEHNDSTILTVDSSGNITPSNQMYPKVPSFHAYGNTDQSISTSTWTKIQLNDTEWDTTGDFDSTTNYRFTPSVAGYYQMNMCVRFTNSGSLQQAQVSIYKNGSTYRNFSNLRDIVSTLPMHILGSGLVYLNGSTDYIELYINLVMTSPVLDHAAGHSHCWLEANLVSV